MKTKKIIKFILTGLIILIALSILAGCGDKDNSGNQDDKDNGGKSEAENNPKVQVEMENGDIFIIELYPEYAPKTVDNFVKLVKDGFYDGLTFHRVYEGFMAQGGGYDAAGTKKDADSIKGEFKNNGYDKNTLKHTRGVISMARIGGMNDSASSEFFIMYGTSTGLDGDYAAFGKVTEGMEVIDSFLKVEKTIYMDNVPTKPVEPIIIKKMTMAD